MIPTPTTTINIVRVLPIWSEALGYCANQALERNGPGCVSYSATRDELTYHLKLDDLDRELFEMLLGTEEIWVVTGAGEES